ncbi:hypothetical protein ACU4GR_26905 [Methylobacterium oryzae CBMB20]
MAGQRKLSDGAASATEPVAAGSDLAGAADATGAAAFGASLAATFSAFSAAGSLLRSLLRCLLGGLRLRELLGSLGLRGGLGLCLGIRLLLVRLADLSGAHVPRLAVVLGRGLLVGLGLGDLPGRGVAGEGLLAVRLLLGGGAFGGFLGLFALGLFALGFLALGLLALGLLALGVLALGGFLRGLSGLFALRRDLALDLLGVLALLLRGRAGRAVIGAAAGFMPDAL